MTNSFDQDSPIDALMTTRGQRIGDDRDGFGSLVMNRLWLAPDYPASSDQRFEDQLEVLTLGAMPGSLKGRMPEELYVFSRGNTPDKPLDMAQFSYTKSLFVVSNKIKQIIQGLPIKNSEFYPVSMVYSNKGADPDVWGGGQVVSNTHWLWWCYAVYDLVDVECTQALLTPQTEPNRAISKDPLVDFHHIGRRRSSPPITVGLKYVPYEESAAFRILGWSSADMIVSPAFVNALTASGLVYPDGPILISALPLDGPRYAKIKVDFSKKLIPLKPPLRIFGTNIITADYNDLPFVSRRSPLFPISSHEQ